MKTPLKIIETKKSIRLSPTSVICWLKCPREFYYHYILKLPTLPTIHMVKGNIVHKVLETFYKVYKEDLDKLMSEIFEKTWVKFKKKLDELNLEKEELDIAKNDCKNIIDLHLLIFKTKIKGLTEVKKVENEKHAFYTLRPKFRELWLEDKELNLCGYVDRVHTGYDGKTTIGDYKTGSMFGIGINENYDLQTGIYALLYKRLEKKIADFTSVIFLRYGLEVRTRITPSLIKMALETVQRVRDKTTTDKIEDYPIKENKLCKWCNYFDKCSGVEKAEDKIRQTKVLEQMKAK